MNTKKAKKLIAPIVIALMTIYASNTEVYNALLQEHLDKQVFTAILPIITYATALWVKSSSQSQQ